MDTREILLRERERIERRLEQLDRYPADDPYEDGVVLRWKWRLPAVNVPNTPGRTYTYAAVRANKRYYTTAADDPRGGRSWAQFVQWLSSRGEVGPLRVMVRKDKADRTAQVTATQFNQRLGVPVTDLPSRELLAHLIQDHGFEGLGLLSAATAGEIHRLDHNRPNSPVPSHVGQYKHGDEPVDAAQVKILYEDLQVVRARLHSAEQIHLDRLLGAALNETTVLAAACKYIPERD